MVYKIHKPRGKFHATMDTDSLQYWSSQLEKDTYIKVTREEAADLLKLARSYEYTIRKVK